MQHFENARKSAKMDATTPFQKIPKQCGRAFIKMISQPSTQFPFNDFIVKWIQVRREPNDNVDSLWAKFKKDSDLKQRSKDAKLKANETTKNWVYYKINSTFQNKRTSDRAKMATALQSLDI